MTDSNEKETLLKTHHARIDALVAGDFETLARFISDDLIYTSPAGRTQNKTQVFESFRSGHTRVEHMETDDTEVRLHGNAAVITYRAKTKIVDGTRETTGYIRSTATYIKESSGWRLLSQQQTRVE